MKEIQYEIVKEIAVLSKGDSGYTKEINLMKCFHYLKKGQDIRRRLARHGMTTVVGRVQKIMKVQTGTVDLIMKIPST